MDLWDVDIRRAYPFQNEKAFLAERTTEALGFSMTCTGLTDSSTPVAAFSTPYFMKPSARRCCVGELAGFERPLWFDKDAAPKGSTPTMILSGSVRLPRNAERQRNGP